MITLIVFYLHTVFAAAFFTHQYQDEGAGAGVLALAFMGIIFAVGWSISTFLLKNIMTPGGFGMLLDRDAFSLVLLTAGEIVFYYLYFRESEKKLQR